MLKFDAATAAFLNRVYGGRDFTERRYANLAVLDPRPGETVLDLGCGNGKLLPELDRAMTGRGRIVGVDMSPDMLGMAAEATRGLETVELRAGDALAIPLPDASVDRIVSIQVFEYIADLAPALAECARVLRPGGLLVIGDMHFGTLAWASEDPGRMADLLRVYDSHLADPIVPEKLPGLMAGAGFGGVSVTPYQITDFTLRGDGLAAAMLHLVSSFAKDRGIDPAVCRAWRDEQEARAAQGTFFFAVTHVIVSGTRN